MAQVQSKETRKVSELMIDAITNFIGYGVTTVAGELKKFVVDNYKDNWGSIAFMVWWDCWGVIGEYCRGGPYHIPDGPLRDYLDELYHEALRDYAKTEAGRKKCDVYEDEVECSLSHIDIVKLFKFYVEPKLQENEKMLVLYTDEDLFAEVYVFLAREPDP